jgi:hypothetical protein
MACNLLLSIVLCCQSELVQLLVRVRAAADREAHKCAANGCANGRGNGQKGDVALCQHMQSHCAALEAALSSTSAAAMRRGSLGTMAGGGSNDSSKSGLKRTGSSIANAATAAAIATASAAAASGARRSSTSNSSSSRPTIHTNGVHSNVDTNSGSSSRSQPSLVVAS